MKRVKKPLPTGNMEFEEIFAKFTERWGGGHINNLNFFHSLYHSCFEIFRGGGLHLISPLQKVLVQNCSHESSSSATLVSERPAALQYRDINTDIILRVRFCRCSMEGRLIYVPASDTTCKRRKGGILFVPSTFIPNINPCRIFIFRSELFSAYILYTKFNPL